MLAETPADRAALDFISDMADQVSMPGVYHDVRYLIGNSESNITDFVDVIKNDSSLSVRLSRITDSDYFGFPRRAEDLYQAISLIGIMQLHDLILNSLSLRTFSAVPHQLFNLEAFWIYSINCGIAARTIAQHSQIFPINPYFTYGLLHEIGHAAMFIRKPELSMQVLESVEQPITHQLEKERELFGFDYTDVGTALIRLWCLPEVYQQIVSCHLEVEKADESHQLAVRVVHLAHQICQTEQIQNIEDILQIQKNAEPQLQKLPDNIASIINREIELNSLPVLDMLWPSGVPKSTASNLSTDQ
ncbi:MAG: HDOD domain-containing protein [Gammaproteobacteria bacterium]|nr:HDOD domain-containing protein [Gammaproteobacteria bacterium]